MKRTLSSLFILLLLALVACAPAPVTPTTAPPAEPTDAPAPPATAEPVQQPADEAEQPAESAEAAEPAEPTFSYSGTGQWQRYATIADYESATGQTIASFQQAPALDAAVSSGALPPVAERIPAEAAVIAPADQIGTYGGTLRGTGGGIEDVLWEFPFSYKADLSDTQPNIIRGYDVNDDATVYTFYLRDGMRWSDGEPFTSNDWVWYYNNVLRNEEMWPGGLGEFSTASGMAEMDAPDDLTVRMTFQESNGLFPLVLSRVRPLFAPVHYMSQFHPDFADADALAAELAASGLPDWTALWEAKGEYGLNPELPTIFAWRVVSDPSEPVFVLERNPYYWKIDPAGNQLPYIDTVQLDKDLDNEVILVKAIAGEVDFTSGEVLNPTANYALLKQNEADGNFVIVPTIGQAVTVGTILFNYSIEDDVQRDLYNNKDFRIALSQGTDRDAINAILYNGLMTPSQYAPAAGAPYNGDDPKFRQYTDYDPAAANALLDSLGLTLENGVRMRPDGQPLEIVMFMAQEEECQNSVPIAELIKAQWEEELGIQLVLRPSDTSFWDFAEIGDAQGIFLTCWGMGNAYPYSLGRDEIVVPLGVWPVHGQWGYWLISDGEEGTEPPDAVKQMAALARDFQSATNPADAQAVEAQIADMHADNLWVLGLLQRPATFVQANLSTFSTRMGNISSPAARDWNYNALESWYIKP